MVSWHEKANPVMDVESVPPPAPGVEATINEQASAKHELSPRPDDANFSDGGSSELTSSDEERIDSGMTAWMVVLGAWCVSFCTYGWINSVGIFQQYYATGPLHEYTASQIAWIPALQIFFMSALGPIIGSWFDRYGPRILLLGGSLMHVFGLMMASISTKYYQFLLSQGVCSALGVASIFLATIGCVSGWFDRRRGLAFGLFATGSSLGGVVLPIMVTRLIKSVGYGWAMRTGAFLILALCVIANLTIRRRSSIAVQKTVSAGHFKKPFRELPFVFLLVGLAFVPFGLYTPIDYLPTISVLHGTSEDLAQYLVSIYNAGSLFGRLGSGVIGDRLGRFNVFIVSCYLAGICILAIWVPATGQAATIVFTVLFGISSGAYIALSAALVAQISPIEEIGYRNGVAALAQSVGGLAATPIAGAILQQPNGILGVKVYAGAFLLAGTTGIMFARLIKTNFNLRAIL